MKNEAKVKRFFVFAGINSDINIQTDNAKQILKRLYPMLDDDFIDPLIEESKQDLMDKLCRYYMNHFTESEIDTLIKFWSVSPANVIASQQFREGIRRISEDWVNDMNRECLDKACESEDI